MRVSSRLEQNPEKIINQHSAKYNPLVISKESKFTLPSDIKKPKLVDKSLELPQLEIINYSKISITPALRRD